MVVLLAMPSQLHEAVLQLFRNRPELAPALLREVLRVDLPSYAQARIESADLTDVQRSKSLLPRLPPVSAWILQVRVIL